MNNRNDFPSIFFHRVLFVKQINIKFFIIWGNLTRNVSIVDWVLDGRMFGVETSDGAVNVDGDGFP